VNIKQNPKL